MISQGSNLIEVQVNGGEVCVSNKAEEVLSILGLGSCVGVIAYDHKNSTGGIVHIQLPNSNTGRSSKSVKRHAFADVGIPELIDQIKRLTRDLDSIRAVLVGGAQSELGENDVFRVGMQNQEACVKILGQLGIPIKETRLGGQDWRSVKLFIKTGQVSIQSKDQESETINFSKNSDFRSKFVTFESLSKEENVFSKNEAKVPIRDVEIGKGRIIPKNLEEIKQILAPLNGETKNCFPRDQNILNCGDFWRKKSKSSRMQSQEQVDAPEDVFKALVPLLRQTNGSVKKG